MALLPPQARTILKYALFYHGGRHLQKILNIAERSHPGTDRELLPRVRTYDLRHRFASAALCRWLDEGRNLYNMLPYLRVYMGHKTLAQTAYYIHLLPENLLKSKGIEWDRLNDVIPEAEEWED